MLTSGASSSRAIDGNCSRGRSVSHAAVQADEVAYRTPVGRSIIDGGTEEKGEALLDCGAQRRRAAPAESALSCPSVAPEPTQDLLAWCTPTVPFAIVRPTGGDSMGGDSPSVTRSNSRRKHDAIQDEWLPCDDSDLDSLSAYDDVFVPGFGFPPQGRPELPTSTPVYNKFAGEYVQAAMGYWPHGARLRNVKVGQFAVADRVHVGEVARHNNQTFVYNIGGRRADTPRSALRIEGAHHVGLDYSIDKGGSGACGRPLPSHVRVVYIDTNKLHWCSVDSVAFQSFAWPRNTREARGIARSLYASHCRWADVLIVRGRCSSKHKVCFRANRVLESLFWNWSQLGRPYLVYTEGFGPSVRHGMGSEGPIPNWLNRWCVHKDFCQCHMIGGCKHGFSARGTWLP